MLLSFLFPQHFSDGCFFLLQEEEFRKIKNPKRNKKLISYDLFDTCLTAADVTP